MIYRLPQRIRWDKNQSMLHDTIKYLNKIRTKYPDFAGHIEEDIQIYKDNLAIDIVEVGRARFSFEQWER